MVVFHTIICKPSFSINNLRDSVFHVKTSIQINCFGIWCIFFVFRVWNQSSLFIKVFVVIKWFGIMYTTQITLFHTSWHAYVVFRCHIKSVLKPNKVFLNVSWALIPECCAASSVWFRLRRLLLPVIEHALGFLCFYKVGREQHGGWFDKNLGCSFGNCVPLKQAMAAIRHNLQREVFKPSEERLYAVVNVTKAGKKKKPSFLCAAGMFLTKPFM